MQKIILEATDIHKTYTAGPRQLEILKGISLQIAAGGFTAITGPSGVGKSTLLHILGGLDAPTRGEVVFEGRKMYAVSDTILTRLRNEKIGFVFQFYHLMPEFTVLENVMIPGLLRAGTNIRREEIRRQACGLLSHVGLSERLTHFPSQLSGGEKQRAAIARALMNSPKVLFCDEPTGNLDAQTAREIIGMIDRIRKEKEMAVVLVTHNSEIAAHAQQRYLRDGRLQ